MFKKLLVTGVALCALSAMPAMAEMGHSLHHNMGGKAHAGHKRADLVGPASVMRTHTHQEGEFMLSYSYNNMFMDGVRNGSSSISTAEALVPYMMTPLEMSMEMHMVGMMYGISDELTFMGMTSYVNKEMEMQNRMGARGTTQSSGMGDTSLELLYQFYDNKNNRNHLLGQSAHVNFGVSLPTGSVDERDTTLMGPNRKLGYGMQLGSGTFDPILGVTFTEVREGWSYGAQANSFWRFGKNSEGYRLGNDYRADVWVSKELNDYSAVSFHLAGRHWGSISGQDQELNPMMMPGADSDATGGSRIEAMVGLNLYQSEGALANNRLSLEFGVPVYQHVEGIQMDEAYRLSLAWKWMF